MNPEVRHEGPHQFLTPGEAAHLTKNPANYRKHPRAQREALRGVLAEIGYASALIAREAADGTLVLIDGHLRADLDPEQEVPVLVLDVTEAEADRLLASMDPIAAMAGSDPEALLALLGRIETESDGLADLFEAMRRSAEGDLASLLKDPDEIPEAPPSRTLPGDRYLLGDHRLVCGDATDPSTVTRLMGDEQADLFVSDPPYGVEYGNYKVDAGTSDSVTRHEAVAREADRANSHPGLPVPYRENGLPDEATEGSGGDEPPGGDTEPPLAHHWGVG